MKSVVAVVIICSILLAITVAPITINQGKSQEIRVIKILEADNGANATAVGNNIEAMPSEGLPFTVNITLTGTTDFLFNYQVAVAYNRSLVRCTGAWINKDDSTFVFSQIKDNVVTPEPDIDNEYVGYVMLGASSILEDQYVNVSSGLLAQINFTAIKKGDSTLKIIPTGDLQYSQYADSFLWDPNLHDIAFTSEEFSLSTDCGPSAPVAAFSYQPPNPMPGVEVSFDAKDSYDPYGNITQYLWNFGDSTSKQNASTSAVSHTFDSLGAYLVNLTVMNDFALNPAYNYSDAIINEIQVGVVPNVNFTCELTQLGEQPEVAFDASQSTATDGSIVSYVWDFGDTSENITTDFSTTTHIFVDKGVYNVTLTVFDDHGLHSSITDIVQAGQVPIAAFTFSPPNPDVDQIVTFNATGSRVTSETDRIVSYMWDFGDGNVTRFDALNPNAISLQYSYPEKGNYSVTLTVYDNNGLYGSNVQNITVGHEPSLLEQYAIYIGTGIILALIIIVAALILWRRSKPKRHTVQPVKPTQK